MPSRDRAALVAVTAAMAVASVLQAPGRIVPETKLDLVVDPSGFLARALHLWDAGAGFGRIGNQSAGYLLPMGPFFTGGHLLGVPGWLVQRLWFAVLLAAALWGAHRLLEALGIGSPATRVLGAAAYALAPSFTAVVAFQSGGQLPHALLPWAVVPLVTGARHGSPRRAAARSGVAIALMGGVNAAATAAALVAPALFVATRRPGPWRRQLAWWWLGAATLATAWWALPLLVQVRYGFDFTDYTETAATTTSTTAALEVVRGTGNWLAHLAVGGGRWLPGAWAVVSSPAAVAATVLVAAGGLAGLAHRDVPERWWLALCAGTAIAGMASGYAGAAGGPLAGVVRDVLDGPLAPFRNVTKLAPLLALALAGGLAHGAAVAGGSLRRAHRRRVREAGPVALAAGLAAAVLVTALPLLTGRLTAPGSFEAVPAYWREAARWLDDHAGRTTALVVPSSAFGEYRWGRPLDEPLQPLARSPWAVRDLVPLGGAGSTRLLDAVGRLVDSGTPSDGLATVLARSGVGFVVVRNDLDRARTGAPPPAVVHRALAGSPGLELVAAFGPVVGRGLSAMRLDPALGPGAASTPRRSVELWRVDDPAPALVTAEGPVTGVAGGVDSLPALARRGLLVGPVVLGGPGWPVATDSFTRRDVDFGVVRDGISPVLTAEDPATDLEVEGSAATVAVVEGGTVTASSTAGLPEVAATQAVDGDPRSAWVPGGAAVGEWLRLGLGAPQEVRSVTLRRSAGAGPQPARVTAAFVATEAGRVAVLLGGDEPVDVELPAGRTAWVQVTIADVEGAGAGVHGPGLAEVSVPGARLRRVLVVPPPPPSSGGGPATFVLDRRRADPYDATRADEEAVLHRRLAVPSEQAVDVLARVVGVPGDELDAMVARLAGAGGPGDVAVTASSVWRDVPAFGAQAAVDGDDATSWVAGPADGSPALELRWDEPRAIDRITVVPTGAPAGPPGEVVVEAGGERQTVAVPAGGGDVTIEAVTTDELALRFPEADGLVGVAEVRVPAIDGLTVAAPPADGQVDVPCGDGPRVQVGGRTVELSVSGPVTDLLALRPLPAVACGGPVELPAGPVDVSTDPGGPLSVAGLTLFPPGGAVPALGSRPVAVGPWGPEHREVSVGDGDDQVLALAENANPGWVATVDGTRLEPVVVDGWRQGWRLPDGVAGTVEIDLPPGRWYRAGLLAGAALLLVLLALAAARPARRAGRRPGSPAPDDRPGAAAGPARRAARRPGTPAPDDRPDDEPAYVAPAVRPGRAEGRQRPPARRAPRLGAAGPRLSGPPGTGARVPSAPAAVALATVVAFLVAGPLALAVPLLVVLPARERTLPVVAGAALLAAGVAALLDPGVPPASDAGSFGAAAQLLAALSVTAVLVAAAPASWRPRWRR